MIIYAVFVVYIITRIKYSFKLISRLLWLEYPISPAERLHYGKINNEWINNSIVAVLIENYDTYYMIGTLKICFISFDNYFINNSSFVSGLELRGKKILPARSTKRSWRNSMLMDRVFLFLIKPYRVCETFPRANFTFALWRRRFLCNKLTRDKRDGGQENSRPGEKTARARKVAKEVRCPLPKAAILN